MRATPCLIALCVAIGSAQLAAQIPTIGTVTPVVLTPVVLTPIATPTVTVDPTPLLQPGNLRITNLSTRARVTPENPLVTGFAIKGETSRTLLVRVAGPALNAFGVSDSVAAPQLRLHDHTGAVIAENAGWSRSPLTSAAIAITGAFPFAAGSADSAVVATLAPGTYTVDVVAGGGAGGVALVEVYDVDGTAAGSRLANVSTLGTVASSGGEVISGFVLAGTGTKQFLVRGVGPSLAKVGVAGVLADPMLTLFDSTGRPVVTNDDWNGGTKLNEGVVSIASIAATNATSSGTAVSTTGAVTTVSSPLTLATTSSGAFPLEVRSYDAALVTALGAGAYTVQVSGNSLRILTPLPSTPVPPGASQAVAVAATASTAFSVTLMASPPGVALLEIYEVP